MGELSEKQSNAAWQGKSPAERAEASALAGYGPGELSPEQIAFRERWAREAALDANLGRAGISEEVGRRLTGEGAARQRELQVADQREKERKERTDTQLMLLSDSEILAFADQRAAEAAALEDIFQAQFGDAWREEIANRIMDPDDIPERQPGESIEDYRARLEDELIDTMIDPATGEIRPEFRDNPEYAQYAEWALARYEERQARSHLERRSDPSLSADEVRALDEEYANSHTGNANRQAVQEMAREGQNSEVFKETRDIEREQSADVATEAGFFDGPGY